MSRVLRLLGVILLLLGIATLVYWYFRPWGDGPLRGPSGGSAVGIKTVAGKRLTFGIEVENTSGKTATLDRASLSGTNGNVELIGVYAGLPPRTGVGLTLGYPPEKRFAPRPLAPVSGFRVPGHRYLVLGFGLVVPVRGIAEVPKVRLDYHVGLRHYSATYEEPLSICAAAGRARCHEIEKPDGSSGYQLVFESREATGVSPPARPIPRGPVVSVSANELDATALIPSDARVTRESTLPAAGAVAPQVAVRWRRTFASGRTQFGLVLWQQYPRARWRRLYSLVRTDRQAAAITASAGDVTGDGHPDLLVDVDTDGSAGWGEYRLLATMGGRLRVPFRLTHSLDQGLVKLVPDALLVTQGLRFKPEGGSSIHCCYLRVRRSLIRWRHGRMLRRDTVRPNRNRWPPR